MKRLARRQISNRGFSISLLKIQMYATAIVPAHNEQATIGRIVSALQPDVQEIIVIDSASTDETASVAKRAGAKVISVIKPGKHLAIRAGVGQLWARNYPHRPARYFADGGAGGHAGDGGALPRGREWQTVAAGRVQSQHWEWRRQCARERTCVCAGESFSANIRCAAWIDQSASLRNCPSKNQNTQQNTHQNTTLSALPPSAPPPRCRSVWS